MTKTQRVMIQDLTKAAMPVVTEMVRVTSIQAMTGDLVRFEYGDGSVTIINIAPGWNVSITEDDD